jgi:hypothetical protein
MKLSLFKFALMRKIRFVVTFIFALSLAGGSLFAGTTASSAADSLSGGSTISISAGDSAVQILPTGTISSDNFNGTYIQVEVGQVDALNETLGIETVATPLTANNQVSIGSSDNVVYVGNGTLARRIGQIDSVKNGQNGQPLRINFDTDFIIDPGLAGATPGQVPLGWTVSPLRRIDLGVTALGGDVDGQGNVLSPGFISLDTGEGISGYSSKNSISNDDATAGALTPDVSNKVETTQPVGGIKRLGFSQFFQVQRSATEQNFHNLAAWSDVFSAKQGDSVSFDVLSCTTNCLPMTSPGTESTMRSRIWAALMRVEDPIPNAGARWTQLYRGESILAGAWSTQSGVVPADGNYKLVLVTGASFDGTTGPATYQAQIRFRGFGLNRTTPLPAITNAVATSVLKKLTYASQIGIQSTTRTLNVTMGYLSGPANAQTVTQSALKSVTVNIATTPQPSPSPTPSTSSSPAVPEPAAEIPSVVTFTPVPEAPAEPPAVPPAVVAPVEEDSEAATKESDSAPAKAPSLSEALQNALKDPGAAISALLAAAFAPPTIITDPTAAVANPAIGASGDDSAPVEAFDPLGSPESIAALSGALVMAVSLAGGVAAATAGGSGSSSSSGSSEGGASSTDGGAELEGLEASEDVLSINRSAWGDKLPIFGSALFVFLDRFSHDASIKAARFSPMFAKLIIDGAYIRAMAGSLSLLLPMATVTLAVISANANQGQLLPPQWGLFLAMALIGVFDAFAGFLGAVVFIAISLISSQEQIQATDLRMYFGVLFISMGPGLLMTAFRALRKDTAPGFIGVWDRATDFVIAPVMAGVSVTTAVTVLPALAGLTLPVANHVAAFGIFVAAAAMVRVLLEEFATKAFPARLNAINPSSLPEPPAIQQWASLLMSYGMWVFLTGALSGEVWQVYVGSFFFLLPTILGKFSDSFPNSVVLWRVMPQGMPGLVFTLFVSAASAMIVMAFIGANPAFAAWNMILLPLPILAIAILGLLGRHGATDDEVRFSQRNPLLFRLGGVLILVVALRLMGII